MKILVTGSSGHLGEALVRHLTRLGHTAVGVDILPSTTTTHAASIVEREVARRCMQGVDAVVHSATLHKPHVATHARQAFVDTNITGTLNLLEEAAAAQVQAFVFTSTTSTFGAALMPPAGAPAAWITEEVVPRPKNIYGATKVAAEDLCELFARNHGLPCIVLRTSRFFPEADDDEGARAAFADANLKTNEFLHRRVDIADVVGAHVLALVKAREIGFDKFIISATTPFTQADLGQLRSDAASVLKRRAPRYEAIYAARGWAAPTQIDRVYVNERARTVLGWRPLYDFERVLSHLDRDEDPRSALARQVGFKGYHGPDVNPGTGVPQRVA